MLAGSVGDTRRFGSLGHETRTVLKEWPTPFVHRYSSATQNPKIRSQTSLKRRIGMRTVAGLLSCLLFFSATVWAQATAQIAGTVHDASGAVIPGAEIKVTQTATGAVRTTISNENGQYVFANLPLGPYVLEASQPGFTTYVEKGIVLQVDSNLTIDIPLKVGAVGEELTVEANLAQVEARARGAAFVGCCANAAPKRCADSFWRFDRSCGFSCVDSLCPSVPLSSSSHRCLDSVPNSSVGHCVNNGVQSEAVRVSREFRRVVGIIHPFP